MDHPLSAEPTSHIALIGGFLGAGKTTAIAALARMLKAGSRKVAAITNDQGRRLVDRPFLACQGLDARELGGGCFCCRFDDYLAALQGLIGEEAPQLVLCEPVGSCADLVATVLGPLARLSAGRFTLAPFSVLVDPRRALSFLDPRSALLLGAELAYLFDRQIEEADLVLLTKIDCLPEREVEAAAELLAERYPGKEFFRISSMDGRNLEPWLARIESELGGNAARTRLELDYEAYARAEASLGWYDASLRLAGARPFGADSAALGLLEILARRIREDGHGIAHLKLFAQAGAEWMKAGIAGPDGTPSFQGSIAGTHRCLSIIINARVRAEADSLRSLVDRGLREFAATRKLELIDLAFECFRPGTPTPRWRNG